MFTYDLSIFLTSTAFVSTNANIQKFDVTYVTFSTVGAAESSLRMPLPYL